VPTFTSIGLTVNPHTLPLIDERAVSPALAPSITVLGVNELFLRQLRDAVSDEAEISVLSLMTAFSRGDDR
jgi:hypothetical protein